MNTKGTLLLLAAAAAVMGAIYYQDQKEEETFTSAAIPVQTIPAVTSGTVERIIIDAPDQEAVTLTRSGDQWFTNVERKHKADANAVKAIMGALEDPITATVVSSNPESFDEYQVADTSSTKVQVFKQGSAKPALDLLVGKDGQTAFSTYVRLTDSKDVLNAQASLAMTFNRREGWRDRQIFNFSGANTTRIEEAGTSATFTVEKAADDKWLFQAPQSGEADSARISSLANMLASLQATRFVDAASTESLAQFGLEPSRQTIALTFEDKSTSPGKQTSVTLLIGNEVKIAGVEEVSGEAGTEGGWYAKRSDKEDIFIIGVHAANALTPDPDSIKVTPPDQPVMEETETTKTESVTMDTTAAETTSSEPMPPAVLEAAETTASVPGADEMATTETAN